MASESYATSDMISTVVLFGRAMRAALEKGADIGLTDYRLLAYLAERPDGATPGDFSRATGLSAGSISPVLKRLLEKSLVTNAESPINASSYTVRMAKEGKRRLRTCDEVLSGAFDEFFSSLSDELRANLLSGSLVTSSYLGVTRLQNNAYFVEHSVLVGILRSEQNFTNIARKHGLSLGEYRVLLALLEHPSTNSPKDIRVQLLAHRSELSGWCKSLELKGLVSKGPDHRDKRSAKLSLTADGYQLASRVVSDTVAAYSRPAQPGEAALYNDMFRIVMDAMRDQDSTRQQPR